MWWVLAAIALLFYFAFLKRNKYWQDRRVAYFKSVPIFGEFASMVFKISSIADHMKGLYNKMGDKRYMGMYIFTSPCLFIKDPTLLKQITVKDFDYFVNRRPVMSTKSDLYFAKNLISLQGDSWRSMRATLSPTFTSSKMKFMFALMQKCSQNVTKYFLKQNNTIEVEMKDVMCRFANDVIASTCFGFECDSLEEPNNEFRVTGLSATNFGGINALKMFGYTLSPFLMELFKAKLVTDKVAAFFKHIVLGSIKLRKEKSIVRLDMIHLLMEAQKGKLKDEEQIKENGNYAIVSDSEYMEENQKRKSREAISDEDIVAQAIMLFTAGIETASTLMAFMAYELAINPDLQKRLQDEIDETNRIYNDQITYDVLLNMKYMDMVVAETLRKWPPFTISDRQCIKEYIIPAANSKEHTIVVEKGMLILYSIFGIHRDPKYYPNPEKFDPERFSAENKSKIEPFTFIPFGAGPRGCIGMRFGLLETKIMFYTILTHFDFVPIERTQIPLKLSSNRIPLYGQKGIWLGLEKRR